MAARRKPADRYHHGNLRSALISTAWTMVSKHGVESLSLRSVAESLGVSHAAPAYHFEDKAHLLDALRAEAWSRFADALEQGAAEPDALRGAGRAYVRFAVEHPRQTQLMFRVGGGAPPKDVAEQAERAWAALAGSVGGQIGAARAADPAELMAMSMAAWAMVHGMAALWTEVALPEPLADERTRAAVQERVLDVVVKGIEHATRKRAAT